MTLLEVQQLFRHMRKRHQQTKRITANGIFDQHMPNIDLPPVFPNRPLNLNEDGSTITYQKSHSGPYAAYWEQADAEKITRLFTSGTLLPIFFRDIPASRSATYVNPICSEKLHAEATKSTTRTTLWPSPQTWSRSKYS
jgi:hypothetical protein